MHRKRAFRIVGAILGVIVVGAAVLRYGRSIYGPLKGAYHRTFWTPAALRDPAIESLSIGNAQNQRQRFIEVYRGRAGAYGLSTTVGSVEGTPIGMTVLVRSGSLTLVRDYTRDSYGIREFAVQVPDRVDLGAVIQERLHPLSDRFPTETTTFLRCYLPTGEIVYF